MIDTEGSSSEMLDALVANKIHDYLEENPNVNKLNKEIKANFLRKSFTNASYTPLDDSQRLQNKIETILGQSSHIL